MAGISADHVDFSRDGKWAVYVSEPDAAMWRSRIDGTERLQLTSPPVTPFLPRWSPDGTQIVYTDTEPGKPWRNFVVSAQGGPATEMYSEKDYQVDPTWSADGEHIVYARPAFIPNSAAIFDIRIFDLATKKVAVVPGSQNLYSPRWSPDGQHIVAVSTDNTKISPLRCQNTEMVPLDHRLRYDDSSSMVPRQQIFVFRQRRRRAARVSPN